LTASHARILGSCSTIFIDGTFRTAPHPYEQLVTVHGMWMGSVIPLCFCLSTGKTVGQYRQILTSIRTAIRRYTGHTWRQPAMVICDFEISLISAIETELPAAKSNAAISMSRNRCGESLAEPALSRHTVARVDMADACDPAF
jgi:hypothetical protein